jgi:hypothetical protein
MFNTLKYANLLEEVGFSREQAETTIKILVEVMEDKLATKEDIVLLKTLLKTDLSQLKSDLIIKMGAMQAASIGIIVALIKLL